VQAAEVRPTERAVVRDIIGFIREPKSIDSQARRQASSLLRHRATLPVNPPRFYLRTERS